ncbi:MAG: hypothetical protein U0R44_03880 [Candidatus Micrarchaeia archaeon]
MSRDKVTVDEPLISTDVDSLIRAIAEKKRIALNDLRAQSKIDKKTMDKWIAVLEDEGYITVEYGIRGTYINWREIEEIPKEEKTYRTEGSKDEQIHPEPTETLFSEVPKDEPRQEEAGSSEEFTADVPIQEEPEPEELLSEYVARKKVPEAAEHESIKSILTRLEDKEEARVEKAPDPDDSAPDRASEAEAELAEEIEKAAEETAEKPEVPVFSARGAMRGGDKVPAADVRQLMSSYLEEIGKEKANIESLKKDRETLYREKFATMEGKMQADIVVLTEKILEKQTKVADLKERVLELPDKVDELSKLQKQMDSLRKESREALQRTKGKADEFVANVDKSKSEIQGKIADVDATIDAQNERLRELEKLSGTLDARSQKLKGALDEAKAQVDDITLAMNGLISDLQKVEEAKASIGQMTEGIKQTVSGHGAELDSLEEELADISRVEHWVQEYVRDYEQKIDDIEQYVSKGDDELADLKEAAEELYLKKYLGELEDITDAYDTELHDAATRERDIDQKITESRTRIAELVKESQEMIKKLKGEVTDSPEKDYGILVARAKAKNQRAKNILSEKEQERAKLAEEAKRTRKTRVAKPAARKVAPTRNSVPPKKKRK